MQVCINAKLNIASPWLGSAASAVVTMYFSMSCGAKERSSAKHTIISWLLP